MNTIQPLRDLVLVKVDPVKEKTSSGLFVVEAWKSLPPTGTITAVGPEVKSVKVGDRIQFERYASIILDDENRLCRETNIFGILDEKI